MRFYEDIDIQILEQNNYALKNQTKQSTLIFSFPIIINIAAIPIDFLNITCMSNDYSFRILVTVKQSNCSQIIICFSKFINVVDYNSLYKLHLQIH